MNKMIYRASLEIFHLMLPLAPRPQLWELEQSCKFFPKPGEKLQDYRQSLHWPEYSRHSTTVNSATLFLVASAEKPGYLANFVLFCDFFGEGII